MRRKRQASQAVLNGAKARMKAHGPYCEVRREAPGRYVAVVHGGRIEGPTAKHAWLFASDIYLGALDPEGLADG